MKTKRDYLLLAADEIEQHPEQYAFANINTCQCGILAKVVLGTDIGDIDAEVGLNNGYSWEALLESNYYLDTPACTSTGLSITQIVETLFKAGFTKQELTELEDLNNFEVLEVLKNRTNCTDPKDVVLYLRAWAALLND